MAAPSVLPLTPSVKRLIGRSWQRAMLTLLPIPSSTRLRCEQLGSLPSEISKAVSMLCCLTMIGAVGASLAHLIR